MPMVDSLISEVAPQLQGIAVARDLQCKSDCHKAQESTMHCVHLPSQEQVTTATVICMCLA